jgi:mono/diheme cytochrome c family protein
LITNPSTVRPARAITVAVASALALASGIPVQMTATHQQTGRRTIWSGVYTEAQAARGAVAFRAHCEACHGVELGGGVGPALTGSGFMRNWTGLTLRELFHHIKVAMPEEAVSSVSEADKLDILTFIFQENGFPPGREPLSGNPDELATVMFEGRNGPEPPPTGATVRAVGCLKSAGSNVWQLTQASEPVRTTLELAREISPKESLAVPTGARTIRLLGIPAGNSTTDQRVVVTGLMIREKGEESVNVLDLAPVGSTCVP